MRHCRQAEQGVASVAFHLSTALAVILITYRDMLQITKSYVDRPSGMNMQKIRNLDINSGSSSD